MGVKEKLRKYSKIKGLSNAMFCKKIGVSDKFLATNGRVYSDVFPKIRKVFTDLNMNWLLYDEGEMILQSENSQVEEPETDYRTTKAISNQYQFDLIYKKLEVIESKIIQKIEPQILETIFEKLNPYIKTTELIEATLGKMILDGIKTTEEKEKKING